ncbi:MAG: hypothetical protein ACM30G_04090 [Micromonosporaceae bacterium]
MGWGPAPLTTLNVPEDFAPGDPHFTAGPDIPAELTAYYNGSAYNFPVVFALLSYFDADSYRYDVTLGPLDEGAGNTFPHGYGFVVNGTVYEESLNSIAEPAPHQRIINWGGVTSQGTTPFGFTFGDGTAAEEEAFIAGKYLNIGSDTDFEIGGQSQGRGFVCQGVTNANSAAAGAETVVMTTTAGTFRDGRVFRAVINSGYFGSVANNAILRVRKTNIAGTVLFLLRTPPIPLVAATCQFLFEAMFMNNSGAGITDSLAVTLQASAGTVTQAASATGQRYIHVFDHGSTAQYGTGWVSL